MAKNSFSDWDTTAGNNTDIASINIDEGCAPSGMNNAVRTVMSQLKSGVPGLAIANTFTADQTITSTDAGAAVGPLLKLYRDSASPAVDDVIGGVFFQGENSAGSAVTYSQIACIIRDPVAASEDSRILFFNLVAGVNTEVANFTGTGLRVAAGNVSLPSLSFIADTDTGLYSLSADAMGITMGGTHVGHWNSTGWTVSNTSGATTFGSVNAVKNLISGGGQIDVTNTTGGATLRLSRASGSDGTVQSTHYGATSVGTISIGGGGTTTAYNTTSDYRRKPVQEALIGFWDRIMGVIPKRFQWDNGHWDHGFVAHEFAEVYPGQVSGEKDAVDEDGAPIYQDMQAGGSPQIADIMAALQDIQRRLVDAGL